MNFDQIMSFLAVVKHKNFSRAADDVYLAQPSLSKQIKSLENELNTNLFYRDRTNVELTDLGEEFLMFAKNVIKEYENFQKKVPQSRFSKLAVIRVGSIPIVTSSGIGNLLAKFQSENPFINIDFHEKEQSVILHLLNIKKIDVAFLRLDTLNLYEFDVLPFQKDEIVFVCNEKNPLSKRTKVNISELEAEKFIMLDSRSTLYHLGREAFEQHAISPKIVFTTARHEILLAMVEENLGVTLFPSRLVNLSSHKGLVTVPIDDAMYSDIGVIKLKENPKTHLNTFWDFIANYK